MKKSIAIKICILIALLAAFTIIWARQDVTVRVVLDEETLIRNGQRAALTLYADDDPVGRGFPDAPLTFEGETRHHSIYEYYIKVPASVWSRTTAAKLEFGQVRRGDHIYIDHISVKKSIFGEQTVGNSKLEFEVTARELDPTGTYIMPAEFALSMDITETRGPPSLTFVALALALAAAWAILSFAIPKKAYALIPVKLRELGRTIKSAGPIDLLIVLSGSAALALFFYGEIILPEYSNMAYYALSIFAVSLILFEVYRARKLKKGQTAEISAATDSPGLEMAAEAVAKKQSYSIPSWVPYLLVLMLAILTYVPAIFPNPYFWNDEYQGVGTADWYLTHGNFDIYTRAWPYSWLLAQAIKFFGWSTVSTRAASALCGIILIVSVFYITKKETKRTSIAFMAAVFLMANPWLVDLLTMARLYALVMPIALWMFYFMFLALQGDKTHIPDDAVSHIWISQAHFSFGLANAPNNAVARFIKNHFDFHFGFAIVAIMLIWLCRHIMANPLVLIMGAAAYVFFIALMERQRKFVNLSIIGLAITALFVAAAIGYSVAPAFMATLNIPFSSIIKNFVWRAGGGRFRYIVFEQDVQMPLSLVFGIFFLLAGLAIAFARRKTAMRNHFLAYTALCYLVTIAFFVFGVEVGGSAYRYMSFLAPMTMILVSAGCCEVAARVRKSTKLAIYLVVAIAVIMQVASTFSYNYIDKPERTKYNRPYQMLANDARNEELATVSLHETFARFYFNEIVRNGVIINRSIDYSAAQTDRLLAARDQPVVYFFACYQTWDLSRVHRSHKFFLETATDPIANIDAAYVFKYHFIEPTMSTPSQENEDGTDGVFRITDVTWADDVAYLQCEMSYIPAFEDTKFIAIEVAEQGLVQSATHRYQVLVPEDFGKTDTLGFTLPVRLKTEEYSENITFGTANWAYVYNGENNAAVVELEP